jgi:hypothetical protein
MRRAHSYLICRLWSFDFMVDDLHGRVRGSVEMPAPLILAVICGSASFCCWHLGDSSRRMMEPASRESVRAVTSLSIRIVVDCIRAFMRGICRRGDDVWVFPRAFAPFVDSLPRPMGTCEAYGSMPVRGGWAARHHARETRGPRFLSAWIHGAICKRESGERGDHDRIGLFVPSHGTDKLAISVVPS